MNWNEVMNHPAFGAGITVLAYTGALGLQRRYPRVNPMLVTCAALIGLLLTAGIPYESYAVGGNLLVFLLGPATVALGVPLYKNAKRIMSRLRAVLSGIAAGSLCGMASSALFVWLAGGSREMMMTLLPKSVSSPISMEIARMLGGIPELGAVLTVLTGLFGSIAGPALLKLVNIRGALAVGTASGTAAHGIGTARMARESELHGGVSAFAMGIAGILVSILSIPLHAWLTP